MQNDDTAVVGNGLQSEPNAEKGSSSNGTPSKSSEDKGTKKGDGVQGDGVKKVVDGDAEDVKKKTFERLQNAVNVLFGALRDGDGKDEAISVLKRVA